MIKKWYETSSSWRFFDEDDSGRESGMENGWECFSWAASENSWEIQIENRKLMLYESLQTGLLCDRNSSSEKVASKKSRISAGLIQGRNSGMLIKRNNGSQ